MTEEEIKQKLLAESPERLLKLIRLEHPDEHGELYGRGAVIDEINRRPNILKDLGWPTEDDAIYLNRFIHSAEKLIDISSDGYNNTCLWSVMEHWSPEVIWTDEYCFDSYNPRSKNKLTGFF